MSQPWRTLRQYVGGSTRWNKTEPSPADQLIGIRNALEHLLSPNGKPEKRFVTPGVLKEFWLGESNNLDRVADTLRLSLSQRQIAEVCVKILSTLILACPLDWPQKFKKVVIEFNESQQNDDAWRRDTKLPFEEHEFGNDLDFDQYTSFYLKQSYFCPIILSSNSELAKWPDNTRVPWRDERGIDGRNELVKLADISSDCIEGRPLEPGQIKIHSIVFKHFPPDKRKEFACEYANLQAIGASLQQLQQQSPAERAELQIAIPIATIQVGLDDQTANRYIIFEAADAGDLAKILFNKPANPQEAGAPTLFQLMKQALSLIESLAWLHAHSHGNELGKEVLHLDLKPDNILVSRDPKNFWVFMITDFGVSSSNYHNLQTIDEFTKTVRTETTRPPGRYQPPEVEMNPQSVGRSVDIWSYGCILCEILLYALGGPGEVRLFRETMKRGYSNDYEDRYYYKSGSGYRTKEVVFKVLQSWQKDFPWVQGWISLIRKILTIDQNGRSKESTAEKLKESISELLTDLRRQPELSQQLLPLTSKSSSLSSRPKSISSMSIEPGKSHSRAQASSISSPPPALKTIRYPICQQKRSVNATGVKFLRAWLSSNAEWAFIQTESSLYFRSLNDFATWPKDPIRDKDLSTAVEDHDITAVATAGSFIAVLYDSSRKPHERHLIRQMIGTQIQRDDMPMNGSEEIFVSNLGHTLVYMGDSQWKLINRDKHIREFSTPSANATNVRATFSADGTSIYFWWKTHYNDVWAVMGSNETEPELASTKAHKKVGVSRGESRSICLAFPIFHGALSIRPLFLTIDTFGHLNIILMRNNDSSKLGSLTSLRSTETLEGVVHASISPDGTFLLLLKRPQGNRMSMVAIKIPFELAEHTQEWKPQHLSVQPAGSKGSIIEDFDWNRGDLKLLEEPGQLIAYVAHCKKNEIKVRRGSIGYA